MDPIASSQDQTALIKALQEKYAATGQTVETYLKSLYFSKHMPYWDYIQVDTLLTLQKTRSDIPDEMIFVVYHQITELYFKLCLHEMSQIEAIYDQIEIEEFTTRINRINRYFLNLEQSFAVMADGMDLDQFLEFRLALTPSSGFQSAQYRMIEFRSTDLYNLTAAPVRQHYHVDSPISELYAHIYWNDGGIDIDSGKATHTLNMFKAKYDAEFVGLAHQMKEKNLWQIYLRLGEENPDHTYLDDVMRALDAQVNVNWPLAHLKTANRYLHQQDGKDIKATGGTNWRSYLPPSKQLRIFYPSLWTQDELDHWGKKRVEI